MKLDLRDSLEIIDRLIAARPPETRADGFYRRLDWLRKMLAKLESAEFTRAELAAHVFPGLAARSLSTELSEFSKQLAQAAKTAGLNLTLVRPASRGGKAEQTLCHFLGTPLPRHPKIAATTNAAVAGVRRVVTIEPLVAAMSGSVLEEIIASQAEKDERGRVRVKFFVSYTRKDGDTVRRLLERLRTDLANSRRFAFEFWQDTQILLGEDWHGSILRALQSCDVGLALVSPAFFANDYITAHELPPLVNGEKPVIPVEIDRLDYERHDLRGLEKRQIFKFEEGDRIRCFAACKGDVAHRFVAALAARIEERVEASLRERAQAEIFSALGDPAKLEQLGAANPRLRELLAAADFYAAKAGPPPAVSPAEPAAPNADARTKLRAMLHGQISADKLRTAVEARCAGLGLRDVEKVLTAAGGIETSEADDPYRAFRTHQTRAIDYLRNWVFDPATPPFAAVLGEVGSGKTTMLQMLALALAADLQAPPVVLVDLRDYQRSEDPTLEGILAEHLRRYGGDTGLEPADILHAVRREKGLIIFDGLDEKIISMNEGARQSFVRELWRVLPAEVVDRPPAEGRGRLIISCRSHYFPNVQAQGSGYTDQDRGMGKVTDYVACIMLPWQQEQIEAYLAKALGQEHVTRALEVIGTVHNLRDLAQRPYLLNLITPELESLERERAAGRAINAATLYRKFTDRWLYRDDGKHVFTPEHKRTLMEQLAAGLWRDNAREWPWSKVTEWLDRFLYEHPVIASRYTRDGISAGLLNQDFRTATFFLRPDASTDGFRFAHTSLQEYFLAGYLVNSLAKPIAAVAWDLPMPSLEALEFAGQIMETLSPREKQSTLAGLSALLANVEAAPNARRAALRYILLGQQKNLPLATVTGAALQGLDLTSWEIHGTTHSPLQLRGADFSGSVLVRTSFHHVELADSRWQGADLRSAEFIGCGLERADFSAGESVTRLSGARLRGCRLTGSRMAGAMLEGIRVDRPRWDSATEDRWKTDLGHFQPAWQPPETVHWQPPLPTGSTAPLLPSQARPAQACWSLGHTHLVQSVGFSPDGRRVLSGGFDDTVRLWDAESGAALRVFEGHTLAVQSVGFSPDGRRVLSGGSDNTVRLWDAESGAALRVFEGHTGGVQSVGFSPDGRRVLSGGYDGTVRLWDAESGAALRVFEGHTLAVQSVGFSPDGRRVLSGGSDNTVRLWDVESGAALRVFEGHTSGVQSVGFSPDGRRVLSGGGDGTVRLWDAESGAALRVFEGHTHWVQSVGFSPDGRRVLSGGGDGTVRLWDAESGAALRVFEGHSGWVQSVGFSPDGRRVLSGGFDDTVRLWDAESGAALRVFEGHENRVRSVGFSPDGRRVLSGGDDDTVRLWDAESGAARRVFEGHTDRVRSVGFSPDGRRVLSGGEDNTVRLWDAESGAALRVFKGHTRGVQSVGFSPDGRRVLSGGGDGTVRLWDAESGAALRVFQGHTHGVQSVGFSPDGRRVLSGGYDHTVRLWDAESGAALCVFEGHTEWVRSVGFSPDGRRVLSGGDDNTVRLWDAESGAELPTDGEAESWLRADQERTGKTLSVSSLGTIRIEQTNRSELEIAALPHGDYAVLRREAGGDWQLVAGSGDYWRYVNLAVDTPQGRILYTAELAGADT